MTREDLEHLIRASTAVSNEYDLIIVGSAAILASFPEAPSALTQTREADIYPPRDPSKADMIDAILGEGSAFDLTFGYYAHGIGPDTAKLPGGWKERLVRIQSPNTDNKIGFCLEPHDLAASKAIAGREKDRDFVRSMLDYKFIDENILIDRIKSLNVPADNIDNCLSWLFPENPEITPKNS